MGTARRTSLSNQDGFQMFSGRDAGKHGSPSGSPAGFLSWVGGDLLSHTYAVSSALPGLTSLFGMGRGAPRRHSRHSSLCGGWLLGMGKTGKQFTVCSLQFTVRSCRLPTSNCQLTWSERGLRPGLRRPDRRASSPPSPAGRASSRAISAARLNVSPRSHLRPIHVVVSHGPLRRPHLGAGFALRCFQRLSTPDAATRRCGWRRNRCTVGPSDPVLSY